MLNYRALDSVFRALADPTRRAIIERLSDGDASVSDLAEPLPISLAAVVQHRAGAGAKWPDPHGKGRSRAYLSPRASGSSLAGPLDHAAAQPVAAPSAAHLSPAH